MYSGDEKRTIDPDLPVHCQTSIANGIREGVRQGMIEGAKALMEDKEFCEKYWRHGFERLVAHAGEGTSKWVGSRFLTWLLSAVVLASVAWLARNGAIK